MQPNLNLEAPSLEATRPDLRHHGKEAIWTVNEIGPDQGSPVPL